MAENILKKVYSEVVLEFPNSNTSGCSITVCGFLLCAQGKGDCAAGVREGGLMFDISSD